MYVVPPRVTNYSGRLTVSRPSFFCSRFCFKAGRSKWRCMANLHFSSPESKDAPGGTGVSPVSRPIFFIDFRAGIHIIKPGSYSGDGRFLSLLSPAIALFFPRNITSQIKRVPACGQLLCPGPPGRGACRSALRISFCDQAFPELRAKMSLA